jgi:hypothetical protein
MSLGSVIRFTAVGVAGLAVAACGMFENLGGAKKTSPDEFRIVTHAPLVMPPDAELRPPRPGAARPQETPASEQAPGGGGAEGALLARAGTERADPNIRGRVNEESRVIASSDQGFFDWLIFWQDRPPPGQVVDPVREQQRLRGAQAAGTPATGDTPTIQRRKKGFLEGIF